MKVSSISGSKGTYTNLSNEFVEANLSDQIPYKVVLKDLGGSNDLAERFITKQRVVKEKSSLGGFRIPQETLKKRVNPSDYFEENKNPTVNSFSFNPMKTRPQNSKQRQIDLSEPIIDNDLAFDNDKDLGSNLIEIIEKQVEKLKRESDEQQKLIAMSRSAKLTSGDQLEEDKVISQYLSYNPDRVQAIKHVTTQFKPEYMSLEELQKIKEEHYQKMLKIENEFYEKKKKDEENLSRLSRFGDDDRFMRVQELDMKHNESRKITPEELEQIVKNETEYLNRSKFSQKKRMKDRAKSAKAIKRVGMSQDNFNDPLNKDEQKFVKKYLNYVMKKKMNINDTEEDDDESWNTTRIKSLNANGVVNRPDGLPGHLDKEDYSMYYYSIAENTPRSLSIKSASHSRGHSRSKSAHKRIKTGEKSKPRMNRSFELQRNLRSGNTNAVSQSRQVAGSQMNSHLAFIKLIFNLLDKGKTGSVSKLSILNDMNLDSNILQDLGFNNERIFKENLEAFPTESNGYLTEQELIAFLLSRSELAEDFLNNLKVNREENNMKEENNYEFNNYNNEDEHVNVRMHTNEEMLMNRADEEDYPGLANNQLEFLEYKSTGERLDKLRESFTASSKLKNSIREFNRDLTKNLKEKISNKNKKVDVNYKDFRDFLNKYKMKGELNFTIPKPFEFLKRDYNTKKLKKIEEILEERKRKEDEILGYRFKPNELKREIFISQFENVIEAEKANRLHRTEKLKEKIIQNMKPFSFYEQDERKFKEKIERISEPPQFPAFKANAVPWTSQVNLYDEILKKMEIQRRNRIEQRKMETFKSAKLPPRMELHEKKKKQQEQEMKMFEKTQTFKRSKSFKANQVPDFAKAHESFMKTLDKKKAIAKLTEPAPFNFHEPKKNASLRAFLDKENDPQSKNPQFKKNIVDIIEKIQQKPKIEPASTKSLNLLMATRRKELEEKQRKEEERFMEDKLRKEKQDRLKERVINSKALVDNSKALEEKRNKQQEDFKKNLQEKKNEYQQDLARRLQRVYNKPLMFEQKSGKNEKFSMNKNMKDKLFNILYNNEEVDQSEGNVNNNQSNNNEDELYEGKFDQ